MGGGQPAAAGATALAEGRWHDARAAFEACLAEGETAEALEGAADACWWLCDPVASVRHRERAWVLLRGSGDVVRAGRAAIDLCITQLVNLGNAAAARGWLGRAERVTRQLDPNPLEGWIHLMQGYMAPHADQARDLTARALEEAQAHGDVDLELVALSDLGLALVGAGRIDEGLAMLDEAMAGTLGGEYRRLDTVVFASCSMLAACQLAADLERATEWCRAADEFMQRYGCPFLFARCRSHYGGVLVARGRWEQADAQLRAALAMTEDAGPGPRTEALAGLADLRVRQGRIEEAEALLAAMESARDQALAAAAVRLARGDPLVATTLLERRVRALGETTPAAGPTLALLVEAHLAAGDLPAAQRAADRLRALGALQPRSVARALTDVADAWIASAGARREDATRLLERAIEQLAALDLPLECARARAALADLLPADQRDVAVAEARRALATFEQLGAGPDCDATSALLRRLGVASRGGPKGVGRLTRREQEVLDLLALGLSNPEIAERLFISRKTASHHVSHVLAKLGLRNRAEAAAHATALGDGARSVSS